MPGIWLITGASGGHLVPAISFYFLLKKAGKKVYLMVEDKDLLRGIVSGFGIENEVFWFRSVRSIRKNFFYFFRDGFFVYRDVKKVFLELGCPDILFCFGAPICFWFVLSVLPKAVRVFLHEQNVMMGDLNKGISIFVEKVFYGLSKEIFPSFIGRKAEFSSNLPFNVYRGEGANQSLWTDSDKMVTEQIKYYLDSEFKILVLGGSQGSVSLNDAMLKVCRTLPKKVSVLHLTGSLSWWKVKQEYAFLGHRFIAIRGLVPAYWLMESADLVVCRAGAMTLTELSLAGRPAVVVPYPYARRHQYYNAEFFSKRGAIKVVDEQSANWQELLKSIILYLVEDKEERFLLSQKIKEVIRWPEQEAILSMLE